jgi:hypothetical protein
MTSDDLLAENTRIISTIKDKQLQQLLANIVQLTVPELSELLNLDKNQKS